MDVQKMKTFIVENLAEMNDYSFMDSDFQKIASALVDLEMDYINNLVPNSDGECDYDDDAAFDSILAGITAQFPQYKMYFECMVDDYLDVSEKYLSEHDEIDWE